MREVRRILRMKAEQAKPDGFVNVRPLDMIALLDDLDTADSLRELILARPAPRVLRCKHVDAGAAHLQAHALVTLRSVPPSRSEEFSETKLCAICAGIVAYVLSDVEAR